MALCHVSEFQLWVLFSVADDVEAPYTIAGDLARDLGRPVTEAEVLATLLELVELGAASAFEFDPLTRNYRVIGMAQASSIADPWFRARSEVLAKLESPRN